MGSVSAGCYEWTSRAVLPEMCEIEVKAFLREQEGFREFSDVDRYIGDTDYVPGAISFLVDGTEVFGLDLWDDNNWLWPFLVRAVERCR